MSDPSLQRAKVALGREVQDAGDLLYTLVERAFDAPANTKALERYLLNLRYLHQLRYPRVPKQPEDAVFELGHRPEGG